MTQATASKLRNNPLWEWGLGPSANRRQTRCLIAAGFALFTALILSAAGVIVDIPELHVASLNLIHVSLLTWTSATEKRFDKWYGWLAVASCTFGVVFFLWGIIIGPKWISLSMLPSIVFYYWCALANGARIR